MGQPVLLTWQEVGAMVCGRCWVVLGFACAEMCHLALALCTPAEKTKRRRGVVHRKNLKLENASKTRALLSPPPPSSPLVFGFPPEPLPQNSHL